MPRGYGLYTEGAVNRPSTRIAVLGSTGSIGRQTLDVIRSHPDRFEVTALSAWSNFDVLADQIEEFRPRAIYDNGRIYYGGVRLKF